MTDSEKSGERIAKLLARAGVASRREGERMIADGRVRIGEQLVETPATLLHDLNGVTVDGNPVARPAAARLFRFHKPSGLITAERDPAGRPTIYTALRNALPPGTSRVMPVGRLDFNTEGMLLLTNDGELKRALELPSSLVPRTYRARAFGAVTQAQLEALIEGIEIEGIRYGPIDANMERSSGHNKWIEMTLTEGKNREVRRVLEHLGLEVSRLIRVAYGPFLLEDLPRGMVEEVRPADVERFRKQLGLAPEKYEPAARPPVIAPTSLPPRLPARPVRSTPRRPETMPEAKPLERPERGLGRGPARGPARSGHSPERPGKAGANSLTRGAGTGDSARSPKPPRRGPGRDEERLVDRPTYRSSERSPEKRPDRSANRAMARGPREQAQRTDRTRPDGSRQSEGRAQGSRNETPGARSDSAPAPKRSTKGWAKAKPKVKPTGKPRRPK